MKTNERQTTSGHSKKEWQKTQYSNLIRYVSSGIYFARLRVGGKLIRRSLKTDVLSVAKLRMDDFQKETRSTVTQQKTSAQSRMTFKDALDIYKTQIAENSALKPRSKLYFQEQVKAITRTWPVSVDCEVRRITDAICKAWAAIYSQAYSASRYNAAIGVLRAVFKIAMEGGILYQNPAANLKRARVRLKVLELPTIEKFNEFLIELENGGGRDSKNCANLVRFLAYGGFRLSEAAKITWADCIFEKKEIIVRGDVDTGTKNWDIRRVPMIPDMIELLQKLRRENPLAPATNPVMEVRECQKAMNRAAAIIGMTRITHHDLRHFFATFCIESGVDIPTVSRWLGHKDGGALAMRVYGHLRDQHSAAMAAKVVFKSSVKN